MFDLDLHMRFVRSSTDAFFEMGKASLAAAEAWQREIASPDSQPSFSAAPMPSMEMWSQVWSWWLNSATAMNATPDFWRMSANVPVANAAWPWAALAWPTAGFAAGSPYWTNLPAMAWSARFFPWSYYQGPLIGMMVSAGMPYAVAAPAARASTSAMDAAEAAQQQWQQLFSAYHSEGGHAASH